MHSTAMPTPTTTKLHLNTCIHVYFLALFLETVLLLPIPPEANNKLVGKGGRPSSPALTPKKETGEEERREAKVG